MSNTVAEPRLAITIAIPCPACDEPAQLDEVLGQVLCDWCPVLVELAQEDTRRPTPGAWSGGQRATISSEAAPPDTRTVTRSRAVA
jgi:hypothetical protein